MPIDGSGNYSLPGGYLATTGTTILTTQHNPIFEDVAAALTACVKLNGAGAMTGRLTLSADPLTSLQAATKQYADAQAAAAVAALNIKPSVLCASTANVALTAEQTIDGQLTSASRVLLKNQTAPAENGIWLTGSGAWSRVADMDAWSEVYGAIVKVEKGTLWADTLWLVTADNGGTLGTTAITWRRCDGGIQRTTDTTTALTLTSDMIGSLVTTNNGSAVAVTVPQATGAFGRGFWFIRQNLGAGAATDTPTTSTVNGGASLITRTNDAYIWVSDGANWNATPLGPTYAFLTGLTEDATAATGDFVWTADVSATLNKKVQLGTIQTLFAASQAQMEAASSNAVYVTPGRAQNHPGVVKAWANFVPRGTNGACTINASHNVTSVTRSATGIYDVVFTTNMSSANYCITAQCDAASNVNLIYNTRTRATSGFTLSQISASAGTNNDLGDAIHFMATGDQ